MFDMDWLVEVFKTAWHKADEEGEQGSRVRRGLETVYEGLEVEISRQGYNEGWQDGYDEGYTEGWEEGYLKAEDNAYID